jgi:hypothetical protein
MESMETARVLVRERLQAAEYVIKKKTLQFIVFLFLQQNNHNHKLIVSLQCNKQREDINFFVRFSIIKGFADFTKI